MENIRTRLTALMKERGLNQPKLVALYNDTEPKDITITVSLVSRITSETSYIDPKTKEHKGGENWNVDYHTILKLASLFNVSVEYLCGLSDIRALNSTDIKSAAAVTGLSSDSIEDLLKLHEALSKESPEGEKLFFDTLIYLIDEASRFYASDKRLFYNAPLICLVSDYLESLELMDEKTELTEHTHTTSSGKTFTFDASLMVQQYESRIADWCIYQRMIRDKAHTLATQQDAAKDQRPKAADKKQGSPAARTERKARGTGKKSQAAGHRREDHGKH